MRQKLILLFSLLTLTITACGPTPPPPTSEPEEIDQPIAETSIVYYDTLKKLDSESIMGSAQEEILNAYFGEYIPDKIESYETWTRLMGLAEWYEVGEIINENSPLNGYKYIVWNNVCEGPCFNADIHRFAMNSSTGELILLTAYSSEYFPDYAPILFPNSSAETILNAALPKQITVSSQNLTLKKGSTDVMFRADGFTAEDGYEIVFQSDEGYPTYRVKNGNVGCFYVPAPDGSITRYDINPGFFDEGANTVITTPDGKTINLSDNYFYSHSGCGVTGNCYSFNQDIKISDLTKLGQDQAGHEFYTVNINVDSLIKEEALTSYDGYKSYIEASAEYTDTTESLAQEILNLEEFLATPAVIYWQDPLGRWVTFLHSDFTLPAECGKPVIYLYPENNTDVSVQVSVDEFTATVPEYGTNGWFVNASPKSELYNYADGLTYPYLFWEARDYDSLPTDSGFMVARKDIPSFLNNSLNKLGLTSQEKADFIEFWEPRMLANGESYFFISFLGTRDFNKIAPLNINPKPDTLIRVFMFYAPTEKPFAVRPQTLSSVPRYGFTVLEWGGTSTKPWAKE